MQYSAVGNNKGNEALAHLPDTYHLPTWEQGQLRLSKECSGQLVRQSFERKAHSHWSEKLSEQNVALQQGRWRGLGSDEQSTEVGVETWEKSYNRTRTYGIILPCLFYFFSAFTQIFYSKCVLLLYSEKNNRCCLLNSVECGTALLSKFVFLSLALIIKITTLILEIMT